MTEPVFIALRITPLTDDFESFDLDSVLSEVTQTASVRFGDAAAVTSVLSTEHAEQPPAPAAPPADDQPVSPVDGLAGNEVEPGEAEQA